MAFRKRNDEIGDLIEVGQLPNRLVEPACDGVRHGKVPRTSFVTFAADAQEYFDRTVGDGRRDPMFVFSAFNYRRNRKFCCRPMCAYYNCRIEFVGRMYRLEPAAELFEQRGTADLKFARR